MSQPSFVQRFFVAFTAYFRILFDADFAARVLAAHDAPASLPAENEADEVHEADSSRSSSNRADDEQALPASAVPQLTPAERPASPSASDGALQLLGLLQRQGRFVDFVQQDIHSFSDADIGQAARVVHEGCRAALRKYLTLEAVVDTDEGAATTVPSGFDARAIKLTGNVSGDAPYQGVLKHRGWRAQSIELPETQTGYAFDVLAPAEVEV